MSDLPKMVSPKATNTYEGVMILGQDESMLLSVGNAEKLRNQLNECLAVAAGYSSGVLCADDLEPTMKVDLGNQMVFVKNVLTDRSDRVIVQWHDDDGAECELIVPEDFPFTVWVPIE